MDDSFRNMQNHMDNLFKQPLSRGNENYQTFHQESSKVLGADGDVHEKDQKMGKTTTCHEGQCREIACANGKCEEKLYKEGSDPNQAKTPEQLSKKEHKEENHDDSGLPFKPVDPQKIDQHEPMVAMPVSELKKLQKAAGMPEAQQVNIEELRKKMQARDKEEK